MNDLINNRLKFDAKHHTYKLGKKRLVSVNQYLDKFFPTFQKENISKAVARKQGKKQEEVLKEWEDKANFGTQVHNEIEDFINTRVINNKITKQTKLAIDFIENEDLLNSGKFTTLPEIKVFSEELNLAGTIDVAVIRKGDRFSKDRVILIDWKTNKKMETYNKYGKELDKAINHLSDCKFNRYQLQLSLYAFILEEYYDVIVEDLILVHILEDKLQVYKCDYLRNTVEGMILSKRAN